MWIFKYEGLVFSKRVQVVLALKMRNVQLFRIEGV